MIILIASFILAAFAFLMAALVGESLSKHINLGD